MFQHFLENIDKVMQFFNQFLLQKVLYYLLKV
jgi:hypothetical protein